MELTNTFTVPAPVEEAWERLLDLPAIAPCLPGATLTGVDGDNFTGTVKVKLGPISLTYKGSGRISERDGAAHRAVVEASGREARGPGTATATITATLAAEGDGTRVDVVTDLTVTGRPAQFGRSMLTDVSTRLLDQFADCLGEQLRPATAPSKDTTPAAPSQGPTTAPSQDTTMPAPSQDTTMPAPSQDTTMPVGTAPVTPVPPPEATTVTEEATPIDLFEVTGARALVTRAAGYLLAFAAGAVVAVAVVRRRRRSSP